MRKVKVEIDLFELEELESKAKEYAIREHRLFLLDTIEVDEHYQENYNAIEYDDAYVSDNIILNEYLFYYNGDIADVTTYCGKHEKAGTSELKLFGKTYSID